MVEHAIRVKLEFPEEWESLAVAGLIVLELSWPLAGLPENMP